MNQVKKYLEVSVSDSIAAILQSGIQSTIISAAEHLTPETRDELLGAELSRFAKGGTGKTLLSVACYADAMRVVFNSLLADGDISKEEVDQAESFLTAVAGIFAKVRPEYAKFASLKRGDIGPFLNQYGSDSGPFGMKNESTKWCGVKVCQNIAERCGDRTAVDALRNLLVNAAEALMTIDGIDEENGAYLDQLKDEIGWKPCEESGTRPDEADAEASSEVSPPLRFPEEHWGRCCAFSPAANLLAVGGNGVVSIWDVDSRSIIRVIHGKRDASVESLAFSGDGTRICVYFDDDYKVRVFNVSTGERECLLDGGGNDMRIWGDLLNGVMVTSTDTLVESWDLATSEKLSSVKVSSGYFSKAKSVALDSAGVCIAVAKEKDEDLRVYDIKASKRVGACWGGHEDNVELIVAGADSELFFSLDEKGGLVAWRIPAGEILRRVNLELWAPVSLLSTPCGSKLIISGWSTLEGERGVVLLVDVETFEVVRRIQTEDRPELALSRDGNLLAAKSSDGGFVVADTRSDNYSFDNAIDVEAPEILDDPAEWDEDLDPIAGEEKIEGIFNPEGWTLPAEGEVEWADLLEAVGIAKEASLVTDEEWQLAQSENRVLTIEHTGDGMEYVGRVGLSRGLNLCRVIVSCSLPNEIRVVNIDVSDIDCNFSGAQEDADQLSEQLIEACQEGDVSRAKRAIASGANLTHHNWEIDLTPLRAAIQNGHVEIVRFLLEAGIETHSEHNAWRMALIAGHLDVAAVLKEGGFDVDPLQTLVQVCHCGVVAVVRELIGVVESIDESADVYDYRELRATPLTAAALAGNLELAELLLDAGASVEAADNRCITPWVAAASGGHAELCRLLESRGAEPDVQHAFVVAADRCRQDVLDSLMDQVEITADKPLDDASVTAVEAALIGRYAGLDSGSDDRSEKDTLVGGIVEYLLEHGASPDTVGADGDALIHKAVEAQHPSVIRILAEAGANLEAGNKEGETALVIAATNGSSDMVGRLLYRGANPDVCNTDGVPAALLMFGEYMQCDSEMAKWFIGYGVDLDATDDSQMTLEQHCERLAESGNDDDEEESDEYSSEQAREVLVILQDDDRLQRLHGALRKKPETPGELDTLLELAFEAFENDSTSLAYTFVSNYIAKNSDDAISKLHELLHHEDWRWRYAAALNLDDAELAPNEVVPLIMRQLGDDDADVLQAIYRTIHSGGKEMISAVIRSYDQCPTSSLQTMTEFLLGIDPERSDEIEQVLLTMKPDSPESLSGLERLRAGTVIGMLGSFEQRRQNTDKAIELYNTSVRLNPDLQYTFWFELAELKSSLGDASLQDAFSIYHDSCSLDDFDERRTLLEKAIELSPDFPWAINNLAWALATTSDESNRDGVGAVELASRVCEQDGWHYHGFLDTLAAAHAETGDFESAVEFAKKAIVVAPPIDVNALEQNLQRYENGEAWPLADEENDFDDEDIDEEDSDDDDDWQEEDDESSESDGLSSFGNSESVVAFLKKQNGDSVAGDWLKDPEGTLVNSIGMKLVPIEPGEFQMGDPDCDEGENLCHAVRITKNIYIGMFAVTQGEYFSVTGHNPSYFLGKTRPVDHLSWQDAKKFCELMSRLPDEAAAGRRYRLPSEAEWEYACRAGTETDFCFGSPADPGKANFSDHGQQESPQPTLPVGCFKPNPWGLYDTHGNVWEWCSDWFDDEYFEESPLEDPAGPDAGDHHALRGGAASNAGHECSSYSRGEASQCDGPSPDVPAYGRFEALGDFGMRVVCEIAE